METARALVEDSCSSAIGAAVSGSEIGKIGSTLKDSSSGTVITSAVKADYDGGGGGSKAESREMRVVYAPLPTAIGNGTQQVPAASARTTAGSTSNTNSLLLRRRRLKRNLSAAAATSTPSVAAASADASSTSTPAPSSNLNTRSLDRKMLLRHRQMMQLQTSDREWVRADLQRGCLHVHDRLMPSYLRPVLCTLESTAEEVGGRLSQQASKGGKVVKVIGEGTNVADSTSRLKNGVTLAKVDNPNARTKAFDVVNGNAKSGHLNYLKNEDYRNGQSTTLKDRLTLPLENTRQQLDTDILRLGPLAEDPTSPSDINVNAKFGLVLDGTDTRLLLHNVIENSSIKNSSSDFECTAYDEVSAVSINGHVGSVTDGMVFDTDSSSLSPTVDSATEGLDAFGSSSDELELDCASSSLVINSIARPLSSLDLTNNKVNRLCDNESPNGEANNNGGVRYKTPNSSRLPSCNSVARPCQTGNVSTSQVTKYPRTLTVAPASEHYSIPTLYVQLHGEAVRRLDPDEKPLQIQNDYLFQLGFKDPWRVQEEGMDSEIGCLIRFYAGKPHSIESSERIQLSGTFNVRKGKMQLPVNRWTKRQVILCGTCLIVSSVKDSQSGKMHILPLIGGKVEEVKKHQHCLAFSSTGPQSHTYYICFDTFTEYLRWLRQASKIVSQRISSVDLSCCSLEHLPANLFYSQDLTHLNLKQNFLRHTLGPVASRGLTELQRFSKLRSLNLSNNHLEDFPLALCDIPTLTEVNLSCNCLSTVHAAVGNMHNLQTFLLDGNCLQSLPMELEKLQHLSYLGLSFNEFTEIPAVLQTLTAMEKLCMSGNNLHTLNLQTLRLLHIKHVDLRLNKIRRVVQEEPDFLQHITHLDLRDNHLRHLDSTAFTKLEVLHCERNHLAALKVIHTLSSDVAAIRSCDSQHHVFVVHTLSSDVAAIRNHLECLPEWVCESKKLEVLDIGHNQICELPVRLFCNSSLRKLLAGHNQLRTLPERLERTEVEVLDVQHNQLLELPSNFFLKADSLRFLNASANKLETLPPSSVSEESHSILQELYLTNNRLTDKCVPLLTGHCHLRVLHLAYNHMQSFPASKMAKLEELEEVDFSGNKLKAIPTTIMNCRRMHTVIAHSNCIDVFPEVMQLMEIKCVDLSCNELSEITLPENLPPKLQELDLTGNPRLALDHKTLELLNTVQLDNKVNGVTDSTRILGYSFLHPSVVPRPHIQSVTLTPQDEFFILGSRGLWDNVSPSEAVEAVRNVPDALAAAKKLCTLAQSYGCNDSISAVVVQLNVTEDCFCCCELNGVQPPSPGIFPPSVSVVIKDRPTQADTLGMPSSSSGMASEISSEISTSEMSSEVGSTASDEPPQGAIINDHSVSACPSEQRCCTLHPVCLSGSFKRQLSSATFSSAFSDNGLDSEDEEPIAGVFSNGSRVEVEVDIHCLGAKEKGLASSHPLLPEACDEGIVISANEEETMGSGMVPDRTLLIKLQGDRGWAGTLRRREGDCCMGTMGRRRGNGSVAPSQKSHNLIEVATDAPTKKMGGYFTAPAQPDPDDQFIIPPELEEEVKEIMKQHQEQQQRQCQADQMPDYYNTPL
ncbi:PH domain leucine-rich repeat-containing protein phosphatase 1 [Acipenser ruthenus]|uniref:PH domain leucine-rich repeat-containing protein phosphatase 1 n=1 Tax=Acipenser ruthenus TaxID=7906 RepID=A0A444U5Y4_ACIRT|nr:PH domain leucine-rich repeat-containing protein phosphatase 1 [Acipenser ruthenus]